MSSAVAPNSTASPNAWLWGAAFASLLVLPPLFNLVQYWLHNPLYGYGLWVPALALALAWKRGPGVPSSPIEWPAKVFTPLYLTAVPLVRVVQLANPDWRMLDWLLAVGAVAGLVTLAMYVGGTALLKRWWIPLGLLLTAVPWSTSAERDFTAMAMPIITTAAAEVLWFLRVPAVDEGSILHTALGAIFVSEDCSGIRGVQLGMMASAFWAGWMGLTGLRVFAVMLSGVGLALLINLLRVVSVVLLTVKSGSIETADRLHDSAGGTAQLALMLGIPLVGVLLRRQSASTDERPASFSWKWLPRVTVIGVAGWLLVSEAVAEGWFRLHERKAGNAMEYWKLQRPPPLAGAKEQPVPAAIEEALRYSDASSVTWVDPAGERWELFWLDFDKGALSACTHNYHRPDLCLPSNDYVLVRDLPDLTMEVNGAPLRLHHSIYQRAGKLMHLFHVTVRETESGRDERELRGWTVKGRLKAALDGARGRRSQILHLLLHGTRTPAEARQSAENHLGKLLRRERAEAS